MYAHTHAERKKKTSNLVEMKEIVMHSIRFRSVHVNMDKVK